MNTQKFYVIETQYNGPNQDSSQYCDADSISISTCPARGNMSGDVILEGWCGTTNDWAVYAHGEFDTQDEAEAAIRAKFGDVRDVDANGDEFFTDEDEVAVFKPGKYEELSDEDTANWIYEALSEISADTTDEELEQFEKLMEQSANSEVKATLSSNLSNMIEKHREELREEARESMEIISTELSDFDENQETVTVTVESNGETREFHVQTTDGEFRSSLGCWILTDNYDGDVDPEDFPCFDFSEIVKAAEKLAEENAEGERNPEYINKDHSPYTNRFL